MPNASPNLRSKPALFGWLIFAFLLLLNVWVDFRRPGWFVVDGSLFSHWDSR
jgi:hypothetical protein